MVKEPSDLIEQDIEEMAYLRKATKEPEQKISEKIGFNDKNIKFAMQTASQKPRSGDKRRYTYVI